jgi:hypothetical protein
VVPGSQDAIQILAQAALCFDNRPVMILSQSHLLSNKLNSSCQLLLCETEGTHKPQKIAFFLFVFFSACIWF